MRIGIVEQRPAWAEDRALLGSNPSADPGARTERRAMDAAVARLSSTSFGIGGKAINPSRPSREHLDTQTPGDGLPVVAYPERPIVRFTLNHYTVSKSNDGILPLLGRLPNATKFGWPYIH